MGLAIVLIILTFGAGWLLGLGVVCCNIFQLASALNVNFSYVQLILALLVFMSVPLTASLTANILDNFAFWECKKFNFTALVWFSSCYFLLSTDSFIYLIEKTLQHFSLFDSVTFTLFFINKIFLVASLVALLLILMVLLIELPCSFINKKLKASLACPWHCLRSLLIIFFVSISFERIYLFYQSELDISNKTKEIAVATDRLGGNNG